MIWLQVLHGLPVFTGFLIVIFFKIIVVVYDTTARVLLTVC
jgi:hypothetical protein